MPKQHQVTFTDRQYAKLYPEGTLIGDILKAEGIQIPFICNGQGTCGKCQVKVNGDTNELTPEELKHLGATELSVGTRLACQVKLLGPLKLELSDQLTGQHVLRQGLFQLEQLDPFWGRVTILKPPVLTWESIATTLPMELEPTLPVLQTLATLSPEVKELSVEYFNGKVLEIKGCDSPWNKLAVAVDIGTTTLAAYLVDLGSGRLLKTTSAYNPQARFGADVIARINYASEPDGLAELQQLIVTAINRLVTELVTATGITFNDVIQINLVGNSCMMHLLLNINPANLGRIPFEPTFKSLILLSPNELGLQMNQQGLIFILPGIGGFVGSDISAGVLACKLNPDRTELFIDIGTNGEVVITAKGRMLACSTAAGPAFEGAAISCGMMAEPGAISDLQFSSDRNILLITLNNEVPRGICGTGLIRILVELLRQGWITETGSWANKIDHPNFDPVRKRFYLLKDESKEIYLSQQDIRQFQLAKGAIRTGLELLLGKLEISAEELETVYLAGAFGTYLRPEDAVFLGLLPELPLDRIKAVGNTAGSGAIITAFSRSALDKLTVLTRQIEHMDLANDPLFTETFTETMLFSQAQKSLLG